MLIGACVAVAGAMTVAGHAAAQGTVSPDDARKRLDADRTRLDATQRRSKELQADVDKLGAERQRINERLVPRIMFQRPASRTRKTARAASMVKKRTVVSIAGARFS